MIIGADIGAGVGQGWRGKGQAVPGVLLRTFVCANYARRHGGAGRV